MTIHHLKTWPEHFEAIRDGRKTFELRREEDRTFADTDTLVLEEFDPKLRAVDGYTGRSILVQVTHLLRGPSPWGLEAGAVIMSIAVVSR